ncbi:MAG: serine hydrolase [Chloroflexota bacterium]
MIDNLVRQLNDLSASQPFEVCWYFKDLNTGESANRQGDRVVPSASTRKIAVLMAAMAAIHRGRLRLDQQVEILAKYQDNDSGTFQHLTPGFKITFRDALVMMIIVSDNTCTGTVVDMVGLPAINTLCQSIGMVGTTHRHNIPPRLQPDHPVNATNTTTANDVGLLLELILQGSTSATAAARLGSTPELCQLALDILSWQKLKARLPSLLPLGTKVAHKTGTGARNYHDAGIVYVEGAPRFVLACYTENVPRDCPDGTPGFAAAASVIGRLARACYDHALVGSTPLAAAR